MPPAAPFEIPATNPARAIRFYAAVFGWSFRPDEDRVHEWRVTTGSIGLPGRPGNLHPRTLPTPAAGRTAHVFVCTVDVVDVDTASAQVASAGGRLRTPKMHIPRLGWLAYASDTEGNSFVMMQREAAAK